MTIAAYPQIGQRVICIAAGNYITGIPMPGLLIEGHRYTIKELCMNYFASPPSDPRNLWTPHGVRLKETVGTANLPFYITRFRPLGDGDFSIKVFREILRDVNMHEPKQTEPV